MRAMICPNSQCGYRGAPVRIARGSVLAGLVLLCLFVLPGLLYFTLKGGYLYRCPNCGLQIAADL